MTEAVALLEIRDVAKRFGFVKALRSAELRVRSGEIHALMGANGAGKSTLVKIITGVFPCDAGSIVLAGVARNFRSPAEARRAGIVSVYQDPALVPDLTLSQNMRLARVPLESVTGYLAEMGIGKVDLSAYVRDLPQPILRLIDLARALASEPKVLLLDEITAALPSDMAEKVFEMMRRWRERGHAVIFISHRMAEVSALCDRTTVLRDGVTVGVTETASGSEEQIVSLMLGTEIAKSARSVVQPSAKQSIPKDEPPTLEVRGMALRNLLHDLSFTLRPGEVLGVAALEGQGQDELFDCLAGVRRFDSGTILVEGKEVHFRHPGDAIKAGLVFVPANRLQALLQQRAIRENVALPMFRSPRFWGPLSMARERERVQSAVTRLQIDTRAEAELRRLSGGNQQKVVLARWISHGFKTLLCFDPTRGIDVGTKRQIYSLIRELAAAGSSILLFTSELPEIQLACDRAIVMFAGRIVNEMPATEADEATLLRSAHGLVPRIAVEA
jgi:ribose transport system ATP-binding protein